MPLTLSASLRRGLAAGLVAGLVAGLFGLLVGEIPVREAIRLEQQAEAADDAHAAAVEHEPEVEISRTVQQALLPVAAALVGTAFGGLFGLVWALTRRLIRDPSHWRASWKLGAGAWICVAFVPALTAPPNPPGVGDPATIGSRSGWYLASIGLALLAAAALWWLATRLRTATRLAEIPRQTLVGLAAVALLAILLVVVPVPDDPIEIPARLLWEFRLASVATQLVLWAGIAGINGWLWQRHEHASAPAATDVQAR